MITDMNSRVAMAQKLSIPQLQQAIKNGTVPAYVGVPMLQDKMRQQQQMQMAAAQQQQGQQQQRPIAEEVMDQAGAMGGVDQLPSNLPIQNEEDEENYAGGGIIAFAAGDPKGVRDPDQDPRIIALRQDPAYLNFVEDQGGTGRDASLEAFLEAGNTSTTPINVNRNSLDIDRPTTEVMYPNNPDTYPRGSAGNDQATNPKTRETDLQTMADRQAIRDRMDISEANYRDLVNIGGRTIGTVGDYAARGINALGGNVPRVPAEYTFNRSNAPLKPNIQALLAGKGGFEANYPVSSQPAAPERIVDNGMFSGVDLTGSDELPPKAPAQRGAPTLGAVSPATARQISATNPGAPATLKDAERQAASGSSQASAALTMLDRYVAMMEKSGDDVGRQKKEALYMALIQGGLATAGGTSPNAFANLAAGMVPATQAYQQAIAGIRKEDRARIEKLINAGLSKEKLGMELRKLGIEEKRVDALVNYYNARAGAAGAGGSDKEDRLVRQGYERSGIEYDRAAQLAKRNMANALKDDSTYTGAKTQLAFVKNLKPEDRTKLEKIVRDREAPYLDDITYNRNMAKGFFKKAGVDLSSGGGGKDDIDLDKFFK